MHRKDTLRKLTWPRRTIKALRRRDLRSLPRVRMHLSQHVTLSGLHVEDLRAVLTLAANYAYLRLKEGNEDKDGPEYAMYYERLLRLITLAENGVKNVITNTFPVPEPLTVAERRARVRSERHTRLLIDSLMDEMCPVINEDLFPSS